MNNINFISSRIAFQRTFQLGLLILVVLCALFPKEAFTSGPNSVKIEKEWYRLSISSMMFKHWSERDPVKLQQRIREEEAKFRIEHAPLIKTAEEGVERCFNEWRKRHPELNLVKWSIAKNFYNFGEMIADERSFPQNTKFYSSMGFRIQNHDLTADLDIGFTSAPTIAAYKELKKSLAVFFGQINQK